MGFLQIESVGRGSSGFYRLLLFKFFLSSAKHLKLESWGHSMIRRNVTGRVDAEADGYVNM